MKTKKKRLNDVKHGDIIATPVIYNGAIIVSKNTPIDDKVLERLQEAKIKTVKIQVEEEKAETNTAVDRLKNRYLDFNDQSSPSEVMAVIRQLASSDHPEFLDLIRLGFKKFKDDMIINEMIVQLKKYTPDRELLEYIYKYLFSDNRNIFQSALFILENNRENIMSVPYILKVYSMKEDDFYRDRIVSFFRRYDSNRLNSIFKKIFDSSNDRQVKKAIRDIVNMIKEPVSEKIIPLRDMEIPEYSMKSRVDSIVYYKATDLAIKDIDEAAEIFRQNYDHAANEIKDIYDRVTKGKTADVNAMKSIVSTLIDEIFYNKDMVSRMRTIFDGETYLYGHSLNVCILSVLTAIFLEYPSNKVAELGIAALMADVGMIRVKNTVWKEPRKLSHDEIEVIKYHIFDGLDTLKNSDDLKDVIATVALQHHEREDGTGYLGLRSSDICEYAKIVSVCDVFTALTSPRVYRKQFGVGRAVNFILANTPGRFCPHVVNAFLKHIGFIPMGSKVLLSNGRIASIAGTNNSVWARPKIRLLDTQEEMNLTVERGLFIKRHIADEEEGVYEDWCNI